MRGVDESGMFGAVAMMSIARRRRTPDEPT